MRTALLILSAALAAGCTALHRAAFKGDLAKVQGLIAKGAPLDKCSSCSFGGPDGAPALACAVHQDHMETVRALLAKGADPDACYGNALFWAVTAGNVPAVRALLEAGARPDRPNEPLLQQALDSPEIVRLLLDAGANPSAADYRGESVLSIARRKGSARVVGMLEEAADPAVIAKRGAEKLYERRRREVEAREREGDAEAERGRASGAVAAYLAAYRSTPAGVDAKERLFTKLADAARLASPPLPIPAEALEHADRAQAFVRLARDERGFAKAAEEFEMAADFAPWWAEAYYNLGLAREKAGDPRRAAEGLKRFLRAAPGAPEAGDVKRKLIELQVAQEMK